MAHLLRLIYWIACPLGLLLIILLLVLVVAPLILHACMQYPTTIIYINIYIYNII